MLPLSQGELCGRWYGIDGSIVNNFILQVSVKVRDTFIGMIIFSIFFSFLSLLRSVLPKPLVLILVRLVRSDLMCNRCVCVCFCERVFLCVCVHIDNIYE